MCTCGWTGIHFNIRLEAGRLCTLVMIGVKADGTKELVALEDGCRESWASVLRDRGCGRWRSATGRSASGGDAGRVAGDGAAERLVPQGGETCWTSCRSAASAGEVVAARNSCMRRPGPMPRRRSAPSRHSARCRPRRRFTTGPHPTAMNAAGRPAPPATRPEAPTGCGYGTCNSTAGGGEPRPTCPTRAAGSTRRDRAGRTARTRGSRRTA